MIEDIVLGLLPSELIPFTFIGDLTATKNNMIGLILFDGVYNSEYFGERVGSTIFQPIIKCVVRNNSYEVARKWVTLVQNALHRYSDNLEGIEGPVLSILMFGSPRYIGRNDQKYHEFQIMFNVQVKE